MNLTAPTPKEATGPDYAPSEMLYARQQSWAAVRRIAAGIQPGMTEWQAQIHATEVLAHLGMERIWHPTKIRFGESTLAGFSEQTPPERVLGEHDIFFVDIGPVWRGHEGDAGDTFVVGTDPQMQACAQAARTLWDDVSAHWRHAKVSGEQLYAYAASRAQALGWRLNLDIRGHRISDFPHAIHKGGKLADFTSCPSSGLWVLEIQIAHPTRPFGAFYEDLLLED